MDATCPRCGAAVPIPDAQRNAAKILLKCGSCENMFVLKSEASPPADPPAASEPPPPVEPAAPPVLPPSAPPAPASAPAARPAPVSAPVPAAASTAPMPAEEPLPPVTGERWQPPPSSDFVIVYRQFGSDRTRHLSAKLLTERAGTRISFEQYKKQFDALPNVQKKLTADLYAALVKLAQESGTKIESGPTPRMLCPYHPNDIRAGHCTECGKPLCAVCLKEAPRCRDCRDREANVQRRTQDEQRAKVRLLTSTALLEGGRPSRVLGFLSSEAMCDEHGFFESLTKAPKPGMASALDQAKDQASSRLQIRAAEMGATAIVDFRLSIFHFQSEALGKCFAVVQASGTAVE
ncbi:MAG: heavy metal-binding domain-containing protein [Deltaproteobacteria bacterium]|nr:heavy metal-binding domain-containing protein [Deltaproteobacteria bacterium]